MVYLDFYTLKDMGAFAVVVIYTLLCNGYIGPAHLRSLKMSLTAIFIIAPDWSIGTYCLSRWTNL